MGEKLKFSSVYSEGFGKTCLLSEVTQSDAADRRPATDCDWLSGSAAFEERMWNWKGDANR